MKLFVINITDVLCIDIYYKNLPKLQSMLIITRKPLPTKIVKKKKKKISGYLPTALATHPSSPALIPQSHPRRQITMASLPRIHPIIPRSVVHMTACLARAKGPSLTRGEYSARESIPRARARPGCAGPHACGRAAPAFPLVTALDLVLIVRKIARASFAPCFSSFLCRGFFSTVAVFATCFSLEIWNQWLGYICIGVVRCSGSGYYLIGGEVSLVNAIIYLELDDVDLNEIGDQQVTAVFDTFLRCNLVDIVIAFRK